MVTRFFKLVREQRESIDRWILSLTISLECFHFTSTGIWNSDPHFGKSKSTCFSGPYFQTIDTNFFNDFIIRKLYAYA